MRTAQGAQLQPAIGERQAQQQRQGYGAEHGFHSRTMRGEGEDRVAQASAAAPPFNMEARS
jgi:hypothetical protein